MLDFDLANSNSYLEFLKTILDDPSDIDFQKEYRDFEKEIDSLWDIKSMYNENPLLYCIYEAEKIVSSLDSKDNEHDGIFLNRYGLDAIFLGRIIRELGDTPIIRPSDKQIDLSLGEVYAHDLLFSDNFWDTFYELDIAANLQGSGIETYLIAEGQQSGPDIKINYEGQDIWIECKRKRKYTEKERTWRAVETELDRHIWNNDDLGCISFAFKIISDNHLQPEFIPSLSNIMVEMVNNYDYDKTVEVEDMSFRLRLHELAHKKDDMQVKNMVFTKLNYDFQKENPNKKIPNPQPDESYKLDLRGGGYYKLGYRTDDSGKEYQVNHIVDLDIPWDIDFSKKMETTIQTGRDRVSGFSPSVLMIDIPPRWAEIMKEKETVNPEGESVLQAERMEGICYKEFNDSDSLNAISVNSRIWNILGSLNSIQKEERSEVVKRIDIRTYANTSPGTPLPVNFMRWVL